MKEIPLNIILLIYVTIYLITMKLRFKDEEYFKLMYVLYCVVKQVSNKSFIILLFLIIMKFPLKGILTWEYYT